MNGMNRKHLAMLLAASIAVIITGTSIANGAALEVRSAVKILGNGTDLIVSAPAVTAARHFTWVGVEKYQPNLDDDCEFEIKAVDSMRYRIRVFGGNSGSRLTVRLYTIGLPDGVSFLRRTMVLEGASAWQHQVIEVPSNRAGIALPLEFLAYLPAQDDDFGFASMTYAVDRSFIPVVVTNRGNSSSRLRVRATVLYWDRSHAASASVKSVIATMAAPGLATVRRPGALFTAISAYVTDPALLQKTKEYGISVLENHFAGSVVQSNSRLISQGTAALATGADIKAVLDAIDFARDLFDIASGWFSNPWDDDVWVTTARACGTDTCDVIVGLGDGNGNSAAVVQVLMLNLR